MQWFLRKLAILKTVNYLLAVMCSKNVAVHLTLTSKYNRKTSVIGDTICQFRWSLQNFTKKKLDGIITKQFVPSITGDIKCDR